MKQEVSVLVISEDLYVEVDYYEKNSEVFEILKIQMKFDEVLYQRFEVSFSLLEALSSPYHSFFLNYLF